MKLKQISKKTIAKIFLTASIATSVFASFFFFMPARAITYTPLTSCQEIAVGGNYQLAFNLGTTTPISGTCFTITTSDGVLIDGAGHTITGNGTGIGVDGRNDGTWGNGLDGAVIAIQNITFTSFGTAADVSGFSYDGSNPNTLDSGNVYGSGGYGGSITISSSTLGQVIANGGSAADDGGNPGGAITGGGIPTGGNGGTINVSGSSIVGNISVGAGASDACNDYNCASYAPTGNGGSAVVNSSTVSGSISGGSEYISYSSVSGSVNGSYSIVHSTTGDLGGSGSVTASSSVGNITALGFDDTSDCVGPPSGPGGTIDIENSLAGNINVKGGYSGSCGGSSGSGGTVTLSTSTVGNISTVGGDGYDYNPAGTGGTVYATSSHTGVINANGGHNTGYNSGGTGGGVTMVNSTTTSAITANGGDTVDQTGAGGGNGGSINIINSHVADVSASGEVGGIGSPNGNGGAGGAITVKDSITGNIFVKGADSQGASNFNGGTGGDGGLITIIATSSLDISNINISAARGLGDEIIQDGYPVSHNGTITITYVGTVTDTGTTHSDFSAATVNGHAIGPISSTQRLSQILLPGTINACGTMYLPGTYTIGQDIGNGGECLVVATSSVTILATSTHTVTGNINGTGIGGLNEADASVNGTPLTTVEPTDGSNGFNFSIQNITVTGSVSSIGGAGGNDAANTSGADGGNGGNIIIASSTIGSAAVNGGAGGGDMNGGQSGNGGSAGSVTITNSTVTSGNVNAIGSDNGFVYGDTNSNGGNGGTITINNSTLGSGGTINTYGGYANGTGNSGPGNGGGGGSIYINSSSSLDVSSISVNAGGGSAWGGNGPSGSGTLNLTYTGTLTYEGLNITSLLSNLAIRKNGTLTNYGAFGGGYLLLPGTITRSGAATFAGTYTLGQDITGDVFLGGSTGVTIDGAGHTINGNVNGDGNGGGAEVTDGNGGTICPGVATNGSSFIIQNATVNGSITANGGGVGNGYPCSYNAGNGGNITIINAPFLGGVSANGGSGNVQNGGGGALGGSGGNVTITSSNILNLANQTISAQAGDPQDNDPDYATDGDGNTGTNGTVTLNFVGLTTNGSTGLSNLSDFITNGHHNGVFATGVFNPQILYYNNASGDGDWNNLANWWTDPGFTSVGTVPVGYETVIVSGNITKDTSAGAIANTVTFVGTAINNITITVANGATFTGNSSNGSAGNIIGKSIYQNDQPNDNGVGFTSTWATSTSLGTGTWYAITSSADGTKLAVADYGGYVHTSSNSGSTWSTASSLGTGLWKVITSSADGTKLAVADQFGYVYTSTTSGSTWATSTSLGIGNNWSAITSSADGTKLAVGDGGKYVHTSSNSGSTWATSTSLGTGAWIAITSSADGTKLAVADQFGYVYTSTTSGSTWATSTSLGAASNNWTAITSSADGTKLAVADYGGYVHTYPLVVPDQAPIRQYDANATTTRNFTTEGGQNNWVIEAISGAVVNLANATYSLITNIFHAFANSIFIPNPSISGGANVVPQVTITSPAAATTTLKWRPAVTWGGSSICEYKFDSGNYASSTCSNNGSDIPRPTAGSHTLYVKGTDSRGDLSEKIITFIYNNTLPVDTDCSVPLDESRPYYLTATTTASCTITANNVTLDGHGFTLNGGVSGNATSSTSSGLTFSLANITVTGNVTSSGNTPGGTNGGTISIASSTVANVTASGGGAPGNAGNGGTINVATSTAGNLTANGGDSSNNGLGGNGGHVNTVNSVFGTVSVAGGHNGPNISNGVGGGPTGGGTTGGTTDAPPSPVGGAPGGGTGGTGGGGTSSGGGATGGGSSGPIYNNSDGTIPTVTLPVNTFVPLHLTDLPTFGGTGSSSFSFTDPISSFLYSPLPEPLASALAQDQSLTAFLTKIGITYAQDLVNLSKNPVSIPPFKNTQPPVGLFQVSASGTPMTSYMSYDSKYQLVQTVRVAPGTKLNVGVIPLNTASTSATFQGQTYKFTPAQFPQFASEYDISIVAPGSNGKYYMTSETSPLVLAIEVAPVPSSSSSSVGSFLSWLGNLISSWFMAILHFFTHLFKW